MKKDTVRIGAVGLGGRGQGMLNLLLTIPGVVCPAVCDKVSERAEKGIEIVKNSETYSGYEVRSYVNYKELLKKEELDALLICTTWITHIEIAVAAMKAGLHAAMEVGGASSIEECWQMVRTSEETGKFCMLLENCCYDRKEMALYKMVKEGLFGEIVHCEGGYRHDLRDEISLGRENIHGRLYNFQNRNGELYPTHQLGPIFKVLDINRKNRMLTISSVSSKSVGLNAWNRQNKCEEHDLSSYPFAQGDICTSLIKCAHGETITLTHDCCLPRPYCRDYVIQGSKGIFKEATERELRFAVEGITKSTHEFEDFSERLPEFEHPLWKEYRSEGVKAGHGGMDWLVLCAFAEAVKEDAEPPIDVYDAAAMMAITPLSEQSAALGGMPIPIPDFTNGKWIDREPFRRSKYCVNAVCEEFFNDNEEA
ncbi:MAG: Gfo/Idh/MocA family oxidoreductase [Oscillospiraceae bacterium]|nr:Gfo/Idh/MocA family oxidoreductase [Oscillospiraceae bacterium]